MPLICEIQTSQNYIVTLCPKRERGTVCWFKNNCQNGLRSNSSWFSHNDMGKPPQARWFICPKHQAHVNTVVLMMVDFFSPNKSVQFKYCLREIHKKPTMEDMTTFGSVSVIAEDWLSCRLGKLGKHSATELIPSALWLHSIHMTLKSLPTQTRPSVQSGNVWLIEILVS